MVSSLLLDCDLRKDLVMRRLVANDGHAKFTFQEIVV